MFSKGGFALIEVLVAVAIASTVVLSIYSGVSSGRTAVAQNTNLTRAVIIAKTKLAEFRISEMRGTDLSHERVKEAPAFTYSRETKRFEHAALGLLQAKKTIITVEWTERGIERTYSLFTVFIEQ